MIGRLIGFVTGVSFQRGLALGALVGAAIAGSTLWPRLSASRWRSDASVSDRDAPI